jgi:hypothetical protein
MTLALLCHSNESLDSRVVICVVVCLVVNVYCSFLDAFFIRIVSCLAFWVLSCCHSV